VFHAKPRLNGFDPDIFLGRPGVYWTEVVMRFLRLVIVVPLVEEVFWRGFVLRFLVKEDFRSVPIGTFTQTANALVAVGFVLEHSVPDWPAALAAGLLYNLVAYRTKSLSSCVVAHGITNALLGGFIMMTRQWGFW
jgi:CAAX prenyl protease-like protein